MPIIEEDGGRLNAFAQEPTIEVLKPGTSLSSPSRVLIIIGALLIGGLIAYTIIIS